MNVVFVVKVVGVVVGVGVDVGVGVGVGGDRRRISTVLFLIISLFLRWTRHMRGNCNIPDEYIYLIFPLFSKWCCQTDMLTVVSVEGVSKTR